jgi:hypothetical protein
VVVTFFVSFVPALLVTLAFARVQRPPGERFVLKQVAPGAGAVVALTALIGAVGVVGWDAAVAGAGCGLGILAGRSLGLSRMQSAG